MTGKFVKLTEADVDRRVEEIRRVAKAGDYEVAHSSEDDLYRDILIMAAAGAKGIRGLAMLAVQTANIDFPRHKA